MALHPMRILAIFPSESEDWQILDQLPADCLGSVIVAPEITVPPGQISSGKVRRVARRELSPARREELTESRPDLVLWFGRLWSIQDWKFWRELVRLAPESLLTVVVGKERAQERLFENVILRIGLWFGVIDFALFRSGKSRTLSKLNPQRCAVLQRSGDDTLSNLLQKRLLAHQQSVLWVDPNLTVRSPSMRSLVNSVSTLSADGWSVRGLCYEHQQDEPLLEATRLPRLPLPRTLDLLQFFFFCNLYRFFQVGLLRRQPAKIVHATCGYDL